MKIKIAVATAVIAVVAIALAPAAHADSYDRWLVRTATERAWLEVDADTQDTACDWFNYDRADMYRSMWREIWSDEGISYRDMRIGIYRALSNFC